MADNISWSRIGMRRKRIRVDVYEFAARCLELIDEVYEHRIEIVITKNGVPIARIVPVDADRSRP